MSFKLTMKYLNITNYPYVETYLEHMAGRGWLLEKIIVGSLFIFKKIEPEELEFSISPYEVETAFTRKSKEELEEFENVCESVGWNYCTRSYDLHIYFKEKDSEALDIHTDIEEEFNLLEQIGKKQIKSYYFLLPLLVFMIWFNLGRITSSVYFIKSGLSQIVIPLLPIGFLLSIYDWFHIRKFLKTNRQNIDLGQGIKYSDSKFYFTRLSLALVFIVLFLLIIYVLYVSIFLKNKIISRAFTPVLVGLLVGQLYRFFVKPSKFSKKYKRRFFGIALVVSVVTSSIIGLLNIDSLVNHDNNPDRAEYKVLLNRDFLSKDLNNEGSILEDISILIPRSYEYTSHGSGINDVGFLETDYSKALTVGIARELVDRYRGEAMRGVEGRYYPDLKYYYEEGYANEGDLLNIGLNMEDFNELKELDLEDAIKKSIERIKERSIVKADNILWNVDEAYFLKYDKTEIVLRKGKEIFFLTGKNFDDSQVVKISKEKLGLTNAQ